MSLAKEIKKLKPFEDAEVETFLNLARTWDVLAGELAVGVFKPAGVSPVQYNVLRILRGAGEPLACGEIASRLITREPDMTRLLDRMEQRGLVSRCRESEDRRVVRVSITDGGRKVLKDLDPKILSAHRKQFAHMNVVELRQLIALLEKARARGDSA
jgi:DNA-binding MarR family transcriptional regulator